ncbi:MAG: phenylalanine--tRNA ligase subunit beta [Cephaloticoccus sp.]|nr:phenylalanine--tRNA ligase subunit beta [Cephaloticoccus sp.]
MKISLNWLKEYLPLEMANEEIARAITFLGFEVEGISQTGAPPLNHVVVGEILSREKHPNADKLSICTVDVGPAGGVKSIVCGAPNCDAGNRVAVALPGAVLPGDFVIKQSKIRGQASDGMLCAVDELGMGDDHAGILILSDKPDLGRSINEVLPAEDTVFDIEITPNRPDCQSHLGIARELAAWFKLELAYPQVKFRGRPAEATPRQDLLQSVRVDAPLDCPLYSAHIITGVKVGPSPAWLQARLSAVGLRPINNVVDVGNYVMLEYGQPLHAFDAARLAGGQLIVRRALNGEKITTLDEQVRTLDESMLVIADAEKSVVIAGIMGGENAGVAETTTDLVLECAIFKRQTIRRTSKHLNLSSDSSYRYERGVDPHSSLEAAYRAIDLILATAGGQVVGPVYTVGGDVPWEREIVVTHDYICEKLGFDVPPGEMRAAFAALELLITREDPTENRGPAWTISIPSWRQDLDRPIDLVEEVLRVYGTERIPSSVVSTPGLVGEDDPVVQFNRKVTEYLVGQDFHECANYTLRSGKELSSWVSQTAAAELALDNPFVADQSHLRPTLVMGLLDTLKLNQSRGVAVSRLCETGRVFIENNGQNYECASVGFIIADDFERTWLKRETPDFFTVKHLVSALANSAGIDFVRQPLSAVTGDYFGWQEGHSALTGDMTQGWTARFGLLNLAMVKSLGIEGKVYAASFSVLPEKLAAVSSRRRFADFSLFPAALRDLAVVVDDSLPVETVRKHLVKIVRAVVGGAFTVESVSVFDVYRGQGLPAGQKSLAFSLVFRALDRTLKDDEVNAVFQKIQDELVLTQGYSVRK